MSDINWGLAVNRQNPFSSFAEGMQYGDQMRRSRLEADQDAARKQAYNLFTTDPAGAEQALMAAGDMQGAEAMRKRREDQGQRFNRGMIGMIAQKDPKAAQDKAVQVGEYDLAENIGKLDEQQRKAARDTAEDLGGFAAGLKGVPYEQRRGIISQAREALAGYNFTPEQIEAFDPTDQALDALVMSALDVKTALEQQRAAVDDKRADAQLEETRRANRVREGQGAARLRISQDANARGWAAHSERKKSGGYGTPGALGGGSIVPDDDVE